MYWWLRAKIDQDDNNILLLLILLPGREAGRSTATRKGSPLWRRTRPQGWWPASPSGGLAIHILHYNWSTLWFSREVTRADGREYTCVASNKFGSKVSFFPSLFIAASRVKTSDELDFSFLCPQRTSVLCRCVPRPLPLTFHLIYTTFKFHFYFQQIFNKSATSHKMFFFHIPPMVASGLWAQGVMVSLTAIARYAPQYLTTNVNLLTSQEVLLELLYFAKKSFVLANNQKKKNRKTNPILFSLHCMILIHDHHHHKQHHHTTIIYNNIIITIMSLIVDSPPHSQSSGAARPPVSIWAPGAANLRLHHWGEPSKSQKVTGK